MDGRRVLAGCLALLSLGFFVGECPAAGFRLRPGPKLQWSSDLQSAQRAANQSGKPILIVFGAEWCGYCKKMERETLAQPSMIRYINERFVPVHLDFDEEQRTAEILGVKQLPCTVIISPEADLLGTHVGYLRSGPYLKVLKAAEQEFRSLKQEEAGRVSLRR